METQQAELVTANQNGNQQVAAPQRSGPPESKVGDNGVIIDSIASMWWVAGRIMESGLAPKDCKSQADAFIRMQMGMEVGLHPMQAVQNIANINGRPSIWGSSIKALCLNSPLCQKFTGRYFGPEPGADLKSFDDTYGYEATAQRKGHDPEVVTFTVADAKRANLWGKQGPWSQYPKEMLYARAMGRAAKMAFPDVLGGLSPAEEARDIIEVEATVEQELKPEKSGLDTLVSAEKPRRKRNTVREADAAPFEEPETTNVETGEVDADNDANGLF